VQTLVQLLPPTEGGITSVQLMMIYQPSGEHKYRVVWYGGESTQLHFEKQVFTNDWRAIATSTLQYSFPTGVKELLLEMEDYYHHGLVLEEEYAASLRPRR